MSTRLGSSSDCSRRPPITAKTRQARAADLGCNACLPNLAELQAPRPRRRPAGRNALRRTRRRATSTRRLGSRRHREGRALRERANTVGSSPGSVASSALITVSSMRWGPWAPVTPAGVLVDGMRPQGDAGVAEETLPASVVRVHSLVHDLLASFRTSPFRWLFPMRLTAVKSGSAGPCRAETDVMTAPGRASAARDPGS